MKIFLLKKWFVLVLTSIVFLFISSPETFSATDVSGRINVNTTWDLNGSPYNMVGRLYVQATLTIEPGVIVNGNGNILDVSMTGSTLNVNGNGSSRVVFRDVKINSMSGSFLSIRYAHITGGQINNDVGQFVLEDSYIENLQNSIYLSHPTIGCSIRRNIFIGSIKIRCSTDTANIFIEDNVFYHSGRITAENSSLMTYVSGNNFLKSNFPTVELMTYGKMVATNNYWGTWDTNIINQMIYDKNDGFDVENYIEYIPFLTEPNPNTPQVPLPEIQVQPQSQMAEKGSTVSFNVQATGLGPVTYQWQFNGVDISGETNATLTLTNVQPSQSGYYWLIVRNFAGDSVISEAAHLNVQYDPPIFLAQPTSQVAITSQTVNFNVSVTGIPSLFYYQWQFNGTNIDYATNSILTLTNVQPSQAGDYVVIVSNSVGDSITSRVVRLTVQYQSLFFLTQPVSQSVAVFQTVTFLTSVSGTPPLYYQWQHDGINIDNETNSTLTLTNVQISHRGDYWLVVSNSAGDSITSRVAHLSVQYQLPVFLTQPTNKLATASETVVFSASVSGTPPLYYQWIFNGISIVFGTNDTLTLTNVHSSQIGDYWVIVSNSVGDCITSQVAHLSVQYQPPIILTQPTNQIVAVSQTVIFNTTASGSPPLYYQWQLNETNIDYATNDTLILTNVQVADAGVYKVAVINEGGIAISQPAILDVRSVFVKVNDVLVIETNHVAPSPATITLTTGYTNGSIFYTLDGTEPTFESTFYNGPFIINRTTTIRAIAYSSDLSQWGEAPALAIRILNYYNLIATSGGGGTVSVNPSVGPYLEDTVVTVTATPNSGWSFIHWLGDADATNETINITITGDKTVKAIFGTTFSTTISGNGSVSIEPQTTLYPYGTVVRLSAIPQPGNYFGIWSNATNANINPLYFTITAPNQTMSSLFATLPANKVALTVVPKGRGRVTISPQANSYDVGSVVTINAIPEAGKTFIGWFGSVTNKQNPLVLTLNQSQIIEANFSESMDFTLTIVTNAVGGRELQIVFDGVIGKVYRFDTSTNIVDWYEINTVTNLSGKIQFVDQEFMNLPYRFYKATIHQ